MQADRACRSRRGRVHLFASQATRNPAAIRNDRSGRLRLANDILQSWCKSRSNSRFRATFRKLSGHGGNNGCRETAGPSVIHLNIACHSTAAAVHCIAACEEQAVHRRHKRQGRTPWRRMPIVEPGDGLFFQRAHILPRFCINEALVLTTDTAFQVRMKEKFSIQGLCHSVYNALTLLFAEIDGRLYGGGVLELAPEEFRGLPFFMVSPSEGEFREFVERAFTTSGDIMTAVGNRDSQVCRAVGISEEQMAGIGTAPKSLRVHRMRRATEQRHRATA